MHKSLPYCFCFNLEVVSRNWNIFSNLDKTKPYDKRSKSHVYIKF